jgi:hypothetical protein
LGLVLLLRAVLVWEGGLVLVREVLPPEGGRAVVVRDLVLAGAGVEVDAVGGVLVRRGRMIRRRRERLVGS